MIEQTISDNEAAIAFAIQLGNMKAESIKGAYRNLALNVWMTAFYWPAQQAIRGSEKNKQDAETVIWSMLLPHFTEKGIQSFKDFFGAQYLAQLGEAFDSRIENYIPF